MGKGFEKYLVLIIFGSVWIIGLLIHYVAGDKSLLWNIWSTIDVAFAVSLGIMAFLAYLEFIKSEEEIEIYFDLDDKLKNTRLTVLRKECTRSEIFGLLGMIADNNKHNISYLRTREFLSALHKIQKGKDMKIVIPLIEEEFKPFIKNM